MDCTIKSEDRARSGILPNRFLARTAVLMLLILVPVLSTLAKNSVYYPASNLNHYVSISNKMNVTHAPAMFESAPMRPAANVVPPLPIFPRIREARMDAPLVPQIGSTVSLQLRSPPLRFS